MKRAVLLVLLASTAVWAAVFFKPERAPKSTPSASTPTDAPALVATGTAAKPTVQSAPNAAATSERVEPKAAARSRTSNTSASGTPPARGNVVVIGTGLPVPVRAAAARASEELEDDDELVQRGELAEGLKSPQFAKLEAHYTDEPRDGMWALGVEQEARQSLQDAGLGERIITVHCQTTVCRIALQARGDQSFGELMGAPGLAKLMNLQTSTPYSLNHAELVVYGRPARPTALFGPARDAPAPE